MIARLTAKELTVTIGGQAWGNSVVSFSPSYESISESGLCKLTAKLVLHDSSLNPSNISPRRNAGLWKPSQDVVVRITSTNEKIAELKILRIPNYPANELLTVDLGCWLTWASSLELDEDRSDVDLGTATNCSAVITNLLEASGIPSGNISIGSLPYSLSFPLRETKPKGFVQQAGRLAWGNNCNFLYQDSDGNIQNAQWVQGGSSIGTFIVGQDESVFEPFPEPVQPVEIVRVSGEGKAIIEFPPEGYSESFTDSALASLYKEGASGTVALTSTVIRYISGTDIITETRTTQPQIALFVGSESVSPATLIQYEIEEYTDIDNSATIGGSGASSEEVFKLTTFTSFERGSFRTLTNDSGLGGTNITLKKSVTSYTYNSNLDLVEELTTEWLPRISVDGGAAGDPLSLVRVKVQRITWREERPGYWVKITQLQTSAKDNPDRRGGNVRATALMTQKPVVEADSPPPAGKDFPSTTEEQTLHFTGEATWNYPGGGTAIERVRPYIVEPGISNQQCRLIAKKMVELLESRSESHLVELPITNLTSWLAPLSVIKINDGNNLWDLACDAPSWEFLDDQAFFGCIGLTVNRTAAPSPVGVPVGDWVSGLQPGDDDPPEPPTMPPPGLPNYLSDYEGQTILGYDGSELIQYPYIPSEVPEV